MIEATIKKNDKKAYWLITIFSLIVFIAIVILSRSTVKLSLGFDVRIFAKANAVLNTLVAIALTSAIIAVKQGKYKLHRKLIYVAMGLSVAFLISYIAHHLFAGETKFGGEGIIRPIYFFILITHIILAAVILPFILLTAYRGLTAEYIAHRKLAKYTWPLWLYVAVTGPVIYLMISPYYS